MDRISVSTNANPDGSFNTRWEWWQNVHINYDAPPLPKVAGIITVALGTRWTSDRAVLAEIAAIFHLLCIEEIHGHNRLGVGIEIEVSFSEICKALDKDALRKTGRGLADTFDIALFTKFLSTKFFEANIKLREQQKFTPVATGKISPISTLSKFIASNFFGSNDKPVVIAPENIRNFDLVIERPPTVELWSSVGNIAVSRHALNRIVQRYMVSAGAPLGVELMTIPDNKWTRSWKWLERVLKDSEVVNIPEATLKWCIEKYGDGVSALRHVGSQSVFVLKRAPHGFELVTILNDTHSNKLTAGLKLPRLVGQRIVQPGTV